MEDLIAAINGLSVSIDELTTELEQTRESIDTLDETIKATQFHE